jgi:hypothetical protein
VAKGSCDLTRAHGEHDHTARMPTTLTMHIPGNILPVDRGQRFSDPLDAALRAAGLGELSDEGTQMGIADGRYVVVGCDFHLLVSDVAPSLDLIRRTLREASAPAETTITEQTPSRTVHQL